MNYSPCLETGFLLWDTQAEVQVFHQEEMWKKGPSCFALILMFHREEITQWLLTPLEILNQTLLKSQLLQVYDYYEMSK